MELRWEAANESGFDHYAIERLTNGTEWAPIGRVNGGASVLRFTDLAPAENGRVSLRGMAPGWYVIQARTRDASWVNGRVLLR